MKSIYLILLLFAIVGGASSSNAQPYQSCFGKESTQWNIVYPGSILYTETIRFGRKEMYNGKEVYKLVSIYLREDTLTGKLWFHSFLTGQDCLIMDLSMEKGDTFYISSLWYKPEYAIIDSIYYDEQNRKVLQTDTRLQLETENYYIKFIEGVGPNTGFTYFSDFYNNRAELLSCQYKDSVLSYKTDRFGGKCDVWGAGIKNKKTNTDRLKIRNYQYKVANLNSFLKKYI